MRYDPITRMSCLLEVWISKVRPWGVVVGRYREAPPTNMRLFSLCAKVFRAARRRLTFWRHKFCTTLPRRSMLLLSSQECRVAKAKLQTGHLLFKANDSGDAERDLVLSSPVSRYLALLFPFPVRGPNFTRQAVVSERVEQDGYVLESAGASTHRLSTRPTCRLIRSQKCCGPR